LGRERVTPAEAAHYEAGTLRRRGLAALPSVPSEGARFLHLYTYGSRFLDGPVGVTLRESQDRL